MEFDEFWKLYPKKTGKKDAQTRYNKLTGEEKKRIGETLPERVKRDANWTQGKFIPNPATYLNQGRWDDEYQKTKGFQSFERKDESSLCDECRSHLRSQRHKDICVQGMSYYDVKANDKYYVLRNNGVEAA